MPEPSLISIVDDDQSFRDSMRRLLRSHGYTVAVFPSAAEFLASTQLPATACLVTDIHMPVMTGVELYDHLVATGHTIPTILMSLIRCARSRRCHARRDRLRWVLARRCREVVPRWLELPSPGRA